MNYMSTLIHRFFHINYRDITNFVNRTLISYTKRPKYEQSIMGGEMASTSNKASVSSITCCKSRYFNHQRASRLPKLPPRTVPSWKDVGL